MSSSVMDFEFVEPVTLNPRELTADIHVSLRRRELTLPAHMQRSPVLSLRPHVVDWLLNITHQYGLSSVTAETALAYYDKYSDNYDIPKNAIRLVAMACFLIAAKWEEKEEDIPNFDRLLEHAQGDFTERELKIMELQLLQFMNWNVTTVTPASFLDYYIQGCASETETAEQLQESPLKDHALWFLEYALYEVSILGFLPSVRAASAVTMSRAVLRMEPVFPASLAAVSGIQFAELKNCLQEMLQIYEVMYQRSTESPTQAAAATSMMSEVHIEPVPFNIMPDESAIYPVPQAAVQL